MITAFASAIYTSEPMATRALAAEIRHDPDVLTGVLEGRLGLSLGALVSVAPEGAGEVDIVLTYRNGDDDEVTVGIEAKCDHEVTMAQINKERAEVDHLVLVLPEVTDAPDFVPKDVPVLDWNETLGCFDRPRITATDIESIPLLKVTVERLLRNVTMPRLAAEGWNIWVERGGAGMPSITVESPTLPDGKTLRGQVQVYGRGRIESLAAARFEFHVGVSVDHQEVDLPAEPGPEPPAWVRHVQTLHKHVIDGHLEELRISTTRPGAGRRPKQEGAIHWGRRKMDVVDAYLAQTPWLAKGYTDWAFGVKSEPGTVDDLTDLCRIAEGIFANWFAALIE